MGKLLPAMSLTAALALTIVSSAIVTNCGQDVPRRAGLTTGDGTTPVPGTGGTGASAGTSGAGEGTAGAGAPQPPSGCAQVASTPSATSFRGIWISPTGQIWVAGDDGWIGHGTSASSGGGAWSFCQRAPGVALHAIWGTTDTDVWAVGDSGTVVHWDGLDWTSIADVGAPAPSALHDVWGNPDAHTVWIVGSSGVARRFDGASWHVEDTEARYVLRSVWGTATGPVRVVGSASLPPLPGLVINGEEAVVLVRNSDTWAREAAFEHQHGAAVFLRVSGASDGDVWAVGERFDAGAAQSYAFAAHFDGTSWTARAGLGVAGGPTEEQLGGRVYTDVVAAPPLAPSGALIASPPDGTLFDGTTWTTSAPTLLAIDRRGSALWATGAPGEILHWTGSAWQLDIGP
jgi:hypothetical protein